MRYQYILRNNIHLFDSCTRPSGIDEIRKAEQKLGISLPISIVEFFQLVGNDYDYLLGSIGDSKLSRIHYNRDLAERLLNERDTSLPKPYFVFSSFSDDQFLFVYLDEGEDPAVYRFETELFSRGDDYMPGSTSEGYPKGVSKMADTFSIMIDKIVVLKVNET